MKTIKRFRAKLSRSANEHVLVLVLAPFSVLGILYSYGLRNMPGTEYYYSLSTYATTIVEYMLTAIACVFIFDEILFRVKRHRLIKTLNPTNRLKDLTLNRLTDEQKKVITLYYGLDGLGCRAVSEISKELGIIISKVETIITESEKTLEIDSKPNKKRLFLM